MMRFTIGTCKKRYMQFTSIYFHSDDEFILEQILSHVRGCSSLCEGEHGDQCSWKTKNFWLTWPEVDDE